MAHLFGSDRGDPGLERALFGVQSGALPEALEVVKGKTVEFKGNKDVRLTIDRDLQQAAVDQLKGKHGAVVVLNPQTGEVSGALQRTFLQSQAGRRWTDLDQARSQSARSSAGQSGAGRLLHPGVHF